MRNTVDNLSLILQTISLELLFRDFNNTDLMNELQSQDRNYLERIINQNNEIIKILKEGRDDNGRKSDKEDGR